MKNILILGCTGSIGTSALNIAREFPDRFKVVGLTAHKSALAGGELMDVIDLGDPPADWEVLDWKTK